MLTLSSVLQNVFFRANRNYCTITCPCGVINRQRGNYYLTGLQYARHCSEMVGLRSPVFSQLQYVKFGPATGPGPRVEVCINVTADLHDRSSVILLILHSVSAFS